MPRTAALGDPARARPLALVRRLLTLIPGLSPLIAGVILAGLLSGLATVAFAILLAVAVDRLFLGHVGLSALLPLLGLLFTAAVLKAAARHSEARIAARLARRVETSLDHALVTSLLLDAPTLLSEGGPGQLVPALVPAVVATAELLSHYVPRLVLAAAVPALVLAAVASLYWPAALVLAVTAPVIPLFMVLIGRLAERATERQWQTLARLEGAFLDLVEGIPTLRLLGQAARARRSVAETSEAYRRRVFGTLKVALLSALVLELFAALATAVVAVVVALALIPGHLGFAPALAALILAPEFYGPQRALGASFHEALNGVTAGTTVFAHLDRPRPEEVSGTHPLALGRPPALDLLGLSYTYPGRSTPALDGFSLTIRPGETVALFGPSGSGKSTVLLLAAGLLQPDQGEVRVDGVPLPALDPGAWQRAVAIVPQTPHFLHASLRENLSLVNPAADDEALLKALVEAGLGTFVARLPQGLDTPLGDAGARLSSGQAKRLALARLYLQEARLVLLDEPTAHLDPLTRAEVLAGLARYLAGRTVLLATHRAEEARLAVRRVDVGPFPDHTLAAEDAR